MGNRNTPVTSVSVTLRQTDGIWVAWVTGNKEVWESGNTREEAIRKM